MRRIRSGCCAHAGSAHAVAPPPSNTARSRCLMAAAVLMKSLPLHEQLEPISKSPEEDNEASELYEAEEVLRVVFPTDEDAALPLNPSKEALHEPALHI